MFEIKSNLQKRPIHKRHRPGEMVEIWQKKMKDWALYPQDGRELS